MQLTKLEIKRRNLDAENLQVGVTAFFVCPPMFIFISMSSLHGSSSTFQENDHQL